MMHPQPTNLLIAPPGLPDSRFRNTVLMLTHTNTGGSFALCVNQPTEYTLQDLIEDVELNIDCELNFPIYWGGPVGASTIWMLHSSEWSIPDVTVTINEHWSMTSNLSMFMHLSDGDYPEHFRIVHGYCSWEPGQLECELTGRGPWRREHAWLVANNPGPEWLFEQDVDDLWANATTESSHQAVDSWL